MDGPTGFVLAFGAGLLSFLSPCTLPLLPGYLAYMSGLGIDEVQTQERRGTTLLAAALFVLGFSVVFVAGGATASYVGSLLSQYRLVLARISGVVIIVMALVLLGMIRIPILYQERRFHIGRELGLWSALPLGMAFAFGWIPCIGPTLSAILLVAGQTSSVQHGALLLFCYALGLGVPFLLAGAFAERAFSSLGWFKSHFNAIAMSGSAVLMVMGVFLLLDQWTQLLSPLMNWYGNLNLPV
jgi:cytochrome c-type biogenesis protein